MDESVKNDGMDGDGGTLEEAVGDSFLLLFLSRKLIKEDLSLDLPALNNEMCFFPFM